MELSESTVSQFLSFKLGNEEYGVDILKVQEIKGWERATPVPNSPDFVLGLVNLRGDVVPLVCLRTFFKLEPLTISRTTVVVVVTVDDEKGAQKTLGLVVDAVSEVRSLELSSVQSAPELGSQCNADFVQGLVTTDEGITILLDVNKLVTQGVLAPFEEQSFE